MKQEKKEEGSDEKYDKIRNRKKIEKLIPSGLLLLRICLIKLV
jgi:hypothetical protein